jgi:hypothetical protein
MLKRILFILVFLMAFSTRCPALEAEYGGSFFYQSSYYKVNQASFLNPHNDILKLPGSDDKIQIKFDFYSWFGENLGFYLKDRASYLIGENKSEFENILDELYLEINPSESLFFNLGKENITEGVGYAWNPTDFLAGLEGIDQAKDTREKREEREGVICLKSEYFLPHLTLTAVASPRMESWGQKAEARALVRVYALMKDVDFSLIAYAEEKKRPKLGLNLSSTIGESLEVHGEASLQKGTYRYYLNQTDPGYYEFIQKNKESEQLYPKVLVGGQYTFSDNTNLILEYYHNQDGYSSSEWRDYSEYLKFCGERYEDESLYFSYLLMGNAYFDPTNLRQNYLFFRLSKPNILDLLEISSNNVYNLDDASLLMNVKVDYQGMQDLSLYFLGNFFLGDGDSEFGMFYQSYTFSAGVEYFF